MLRATANSTAPRMVFGSHDFHAGSLVSGFSSDLRMVPRAVLYVNMTPASTHGKKAIACIFVLCPTSMICRLYEQKATAMAPAAATIPLIPMESIRRNAPTMVRRRKLAGLLPIMKKS